LIMTSNIGVKALSEKKTVGFAQQGSAQLDDEMKRSLSGELKRFMSPELLGRIDEVIVFDRLGEKSLEKIAVIELDRLAKRLSALGYAFGYSAAAARLAARKVSAEGGSARDVRKLISTRIQDLLSEKMLSGSADKLFLDCDKKDFAVRSAMSIA